MTNNMDGDVQKETSAFMVYWESVNSVLRAREQPEMLYREARGFYEDYFRKRQGLRNKAA